MYRQPTPRTQVVGVAVAAALTIPLSASPADAVTVRVQDRRGEVRSLDIASAKLNNGTHRLVGSVRLTRRSMRPRGYVLVWLRYRKPRVNYGLELTWNKKRRLRAKVVRLPRRGATKVVTRRCDVRAVRHWNRFRIGVDQDRCFRRDAGRVRFAVLTTPRHGRQDSLTRSAPVRRG